jgi:hypothetical protein
MSFYWNAGVQAYGRLQEQNKRTGILSWISLIQSPRQACYELARNLRNVPGNGLFGVEVVDEAIKWTFD